VAFKLRVNGVQQRASPRRGRDGVGLLAGAAAASARRGGLVLVRRLRLLLLRGVAVQVGI
jgi:hypothetical protein